MFSFFLSNKAFLVWGFLSLVTAGLLYGWNGGSNLFLAQVTQQKLVDTINPYRSLEGLPVLQVEPRLQEAAQAKAEDMVLKGYFAHTSPSGERPWIWFERAGYEYAAAGENLALNFSDANALVQAWLDSPSHAKILQNGYFRDIGIGIAEGVVEGNPALIVVAHFGREISFASSEASLPEQLGIAAEEIQTIQETPSNDQASNPTGIEQVSPEQLVLTEKIIEGEEIHEQEYVLAANETLVGSSYNWETKATITKISEGSRLALSGIFILFTGWILRVKGRREKVKFVIPRVASFVVLGLLLWGGEFF